MSIHSIACRVLAFAERFFGNAVFVCMLVEGIYLHRTIVTVFRRNLNIRLLYAIGFGMLSLFLSKIHLVYSLISLVLSGG